MFGRELSVIVISSFFFFFSSLLFLVVRWQQRRRLGTIGIGIGLTVVNLQRRSAGVRVNGSTSMSRPIIFGRTANVEHGCREVDGNQGVI